MLVALDSGSSVIYGILIIFLCTCIVYTPDRFIRSLHWICFEWKKFFLKFSTWFKLLYCTNLSVEKLVSE